MFINNCECPPIGLSQPPSLLEDAAQRRRRAASFGGGIDPLTGEEFKGDDILTPAGSLPRTSPVPSPKYTSTATASHDTTTTPMAAAHRDDDIHHHDDGHTNNNNGIHDGEGDEPPSELPRMGSPQPPPFGRARSSSLAGQLFIAAIPFITHSSYDCPLCV
jgi:hypothetical protein